MKIAMVTWELPGGKDNNLLPPLLPRLLPEHEFRFFDSKQAVPSNQVNKCDVMYMDADLFNCEITINNMDALDNVRIPVLVRFMGEWMKWHMYDNKWRNSFYKQFNHPNVNVILCEELQYKFMNYLFPSKEVVVYPWLSDLEDIYPLRRSFKLNRVYLINNGDYLRYPSLGIANYLPDDWKMVVRSIKNEALEVEIELGIFDDKLNVIYNILDKSLEKVELVDFLDTWKQYLARLSRCAITLSPDNRFTIGRACIESAALGVPVVNSTSHSGFRLFPDLNVAPYDVEAQLEKILLLINDKDFYNQQVQHGLDNVEYYGLTETNKQKWNDIFSCV